MPLRLKVIRNRNRGRVQKSSDLAVRLALSLDLSASIIATRDYNCIRQLSINKRNIRKVSCLEGSAGLATLPLDR